MRQRIKNRPIRSKVCLSTRRAVGLSVSLHPEHLFEHQVRPGHWQEPAAFRHHPVGPAARQRDRYLVRGSFRDEINTAIAQRAKGHRYWTYNGGRPFAPAIVIDSPATIRGR